VRAESIGAIWAGAAGGGPRVGEARRAGQERASYLP
jgi:hypothetical protein